MSGGRWSICASCLACAARTSVHRSNDADGAVRAAHEEARALGWVQLAERRTPVCRFEQWLCVTCARDVVRRAPDAEPLARGATS